VYPHGTFSIDAPRGTGDKLCTIFTMPAPRICDGQKIVQNFSRFLTTFDFDREYLLNGSTYQKSEKLLIIYSHSHVRRKNLAYFGPQTKKLLTLIHVHPNGIFSGDYISALTWCCAMKFLYALEIDQCVLALTRPAAKEKIAKT